MCMRLNLEYNNRKITDDCHPIIRILEVHLSDQKVA